MFPGLVDRRHLRGWPAGMRVIVRRERPHPAPNWSCSRSAMGGATPAFVTNTTSGALQWLEARHRAHARVEDRIRCAKDTGLRRPPSRELAIHRAWCSAAAIAVDLVAWLQLIGLDGDLAKAEPKRLRYPDPAHRRPPRPRPTPPLAYASPPAGPGPNRSTTAFHRITAIPAPGLSSPAAAPTTRRTPGDYARRCDRRPCHHARSPRHRPSVLRSAGRNEPTSGANHRG
ncbi:transposase [Micromonospora sp. NPDC048830]|uniref:transposase n=1 Tax=Micromonospora sp. NPDC048830 TaxID=3364257 RepID=UPI0037184B4F